MSRSRPKRRRIGAQVKRVARVPTEPHFQSDSWSCGYRNALNVASTMSAFKLELNSVSDVAEALKRGWKHGFDFEGRFPLHETSWIGATEICVVFRSLGVECELIDFPDVDDFEIEYVFEYVMKHVIDEFPVFLQTNGHSYTMIGASLEELIVIDPLGEPLFEATLDSAWVRKQRNLQLVVFNRGSLNKILSSTRVTPQ